MDFKFWNSDAVLGHAELDRQHLSLAKGIAFLAHGPRRRARDLVEWARFITEVRSHFDWEESDMERNEYPELRAHRIDHLIQMNNLKDYERSILEGEVLEPEAFMAMAAWNMRHILGRDRDYTEFLVENEVWQARRELSQWEEELFLLDHT